MNVVDFPSVPNNADWSVAVTYTATDGVTPVDLTGSTLSMQVRENGNPANPVLVVPVTVTITNATAGQFVVSIADQDIGRVLPKTYGHDLIRVRPDGTREQVWIGTMSVTGGYTR